MPLPSSQHAWTPGSRGQALLWLRQACCSCRCGSTLQTHPNIASPALHPFSGSKPSQDAWSQHRDSASLLLHTASLRDGCAVHTWHGTAAGELAFMGAHRPDTSCIVCRVKRRDSHHANLCICLLYGQAPPHLSVVVACKVDARMAASRLHGAVQP